MNKLHQLFNSTGYSVFDKTINSHMRLNSHMINMARISTWLAITVPL